MQLFAVNLIVITAIGLSVQSCNGQCMYIIMKTIVLETINCIFSVVQHNPVQRVTVSGCTIYGSTATQGVYAADLHIKPVEGSV